MLTFFVLIQQIHWHVSFSCFHAVVIASFALILHFHLPFSFSHIHVEKLIIFSLCLLFHLLKAFVFCFVLSYFHYSRSTVHSSVQVDNH